MDAIIEIPKGDTIRRHKNKHGEGLIELGLIKDVIPVNDGMNPVNYGYIPDTYNASDEDEVDVIVVTDEVYAIGQSVAITPIALLRRADHDDKVIAVPDGNTRIMQWDDIPVSERELLTQFYGYHHAITAIENSTKAREYIEKMKGT